MALSKTRARLFRFLQSARYDPLLLELAQLDDGYPHRLRLQVYIYKNKPDLILNDVMMPFMTGPEFIEKVRSMPGYGDVKTLYTIFLLKEKSGSLLRFYFTHFDF